LRTNLKDARIAEGQGKWSETIVTEVLAEEIVGNHKEEHMLFFFCPFSIILFLLKKGPVEGSCVGRSNQENQSFRRYKDEVMPGKELFAGTVCWSAAAPATAATSATATTPVKTSETASITPSVENPEKHSILLCTSSCYILFVFGQ